MAPSVPSIAPVPPPTPTATQSFDFKLSEDGKRTGIETSPLDTRQFRVLTLSNQMRVLLVSDPTSDKAAASLDVSVGYFSDPWDLPGVAHFCEHMLFLGTEKYPDEDSYRDFLSQNSGFSNAYTASENTNYHFQLVVPPNDTDNDNTDNTDGGDDYVPKFKEALDRFSQFFKAPLFTESATDRELNAVDSEHQKNLQRDGNRLYQITKALVNPLHPFHKFSTGSKSTLKTDAEAAGINTRNQLLAFHKKFYSANLMNLCIAGPHDLDTLEEWTVHLFSPIENHSVDHPSKIFQNIQVMLPEHTGNIVYVDPIKDLRSVEITWVIPPPSTEYTTKPSFYLSHLLGHEGKGSLLSILKEKQWANGLAAGPCNENDSFAIFSVSIDLTEDGLDNIDSIVEYLYGYLHLIKESGVQEWIFEETRSLSKMRFHFQERSEPYNFVTNVASTMEKYPPLHYLSGPIVVRDYDPEAIHKILDGLTPEKCVITVVAKSKSVVDKATTKEKWYETPYGMEKIPEKKIHAWKNAVAHKDLAIPPKNEFIPTDFSLLAEPLPEGDTDTDGPVLLEKNEHYELHYKLDRTFRRPKADLYIDLKTNWAYMSPYHAVCTKLATELLVDELTEFSYDAEIAGLHYGLYNMHHGVRLIVKGYNHKLKTLYRTILDRIANFKINPERFPLVLDMTKRGFGNFDKEQPYQHAMYASACLMEQPRWHIREYIDTINSGAVTMEGINGFVKNLFRKCYAVALVGGNVSEEWAKDALEMARNTLQFAPLPRSEITTRRISKLPVNRDVVTRQQHPNTGDNNSAIEMMFQFKPKGNYRDDVAIELLSDVMNKPAFHELRTVQQLGYVVFEGIQSYEDVRVLYIIIQSNIAGPDELVKRIEKFLEEFRENTLENLPEEEIKTYSASLMALKNEPEKKLSHRLGRFWREITHRTLEFHRAKREIHALENIKKIDVVRMFDHYIAKNAPQRKCLISLVHGNLHTINENEGGKDDDDANGNDNDNDNDNRIYVRDSAALRNWCETYPVCGACVEDIGKRDKNWC